MAPNCSKLTEILQWGCEKERNDHYIQLHRKDDKLVLSSNPCMKICPFPCTKLILKREATDRWDLSFFRFDALL
jgi:hypothetical protein